VIWKDPSIAPAGTTTLIGARIAVESGGVDRHLTGNRRPTDGAGYVTVTVPVTADPAVTDDADKTKLLRTLGSRANRLTSLAALDPAVVVTTTSTVSRVPAGAVAVIVVSEFTANWSVWFAPNRTVVTSVKPVPVITTSVPPSTLPETGSMAVTVGAGTVLVVVVVVVVVGAVEVSPHEAISTLRMTGPPYRSGNV
jgi:hypothetical protein